MAERGNHERENSVGAASHPQARWRRSVLALGWVMVLAAAAAAPHTSTLAKGRVAAPPAPAAELPSAAVPKPAAGSHAASHARLSEMPVHQLVWKQWTVAEGLPQITVNAIEQDHAGYLWVATQEGLARFDGMSFEIFRRVDHPALGNDFITALALDKDGVLWAGSTNALARYVRGRWQTVTTIEQAGVVRNLRPDPDGGVWVAAEHGFFHAKDGVAQRIALDVNRFPAIDVMPAFAGSPAVLICARALVVDPAGQQRVIALDEHLGGVITATHAANGGIWLGTEDGLVLVDAQGRTKRIWAPGREIEQVLVDDTGTVWFTSDIGLWRLRAGSDTAEILAIPGIRPNDWVRRVFIDRENNLWIGTQVTGLHRGWPDRFRRITARDGLVDSVVWSVYEAPDGEVWAGTTQGLYRGGLDGFRQAVDGAALPHPSVISTLADRQGRLWIGTHKGLARWEPGKPRPSTVKSASPLAVLAMLEEPDGSVMVGMLNGLYRFYGDRAEAVPLPTQSGGQLVSGLVRDGRGRVWVGHQKGVFYWSEDQWLVPPGVPEESIGLALAPLDSDGVLTVGIGGFAYVSPQRMQALGPEQGVTTEMVFGVQVGTEYVWYLTPRGIGRVPLVQLRDLLQGKRKRVDVNMYGDLGSAHLAQCNGGQQQSSALTAGRWLWCPSLEGLLVLDTWRVDERAAPAPVVVQALTTPRRRIDLEHTTDLPVVLDANERDVEVSFTGLSLRAPQRLDFQTRLLGYDDQWQSLGQRRISYYTNLPPGTYTFELRAINEDGIEGSSAQTQFRIRPYWHETWWARGAGVLLLALLVWQWMRRRLRALGRQREQLELRVRERTAELEQVNHKLEAASVTDPLTGLHNRRFLYQNVQHELARMDRFVTEGGGDPERVLCVLHVDLDRFKQINDTHGHHVGDQVLQGAAGLLRECARASDFVLRWGGEEFVIVGRDTRRSELHAWAERVVATFRAHRFNTDAGPITVTCSIGFAVYPPHPDECNEHGWTRTMLLADAATYLAKNEGRDRSIGLEWRDGPMPHDLAQRLHLDVPGLVAEGVLRVIRYDGGSLAEPASSG